MPSTRATVASWVRRAFYYLQPAMVLLVPAWLVVARALAPTGLGAQDVLVFLSWPMLAVTMLVVLGITWARKSVRSTRAVSWIDVVALSVWYATGVAFGVAVMLSSPVGAGLLGGLLLLVSIAVLVLSIWQLIRAAQRRVQTVLASLDRTAVPAGQYQATKFRDDDVIVVDPAIGSARPRNDGRRS